MTNINDSHARVDTQISRQIATTIAGQITGNVLMSLGAYPIRPAVLHSDESRRGGAEWDVRILPMKKNGERAAAARKMTLRVELKYSDIYTVQVSYMDRGKRKIHYFAEDVYADQLARLCLALDWDGDEVLNPRYL